MKKENLIWISLIALAASTLALTGSSAKSANDEAAVTHAASQFYVALNTMFTGDAGPMKDVWSHADDVTYMGPGGEFRVGWNQVSSVWEETAAMKLGGKVEPTDMRMAIGRDIAVTNNVERGKNIDAKGETQTVSIRTTNIFRKEGGKWKMIGHHTDLLPFLEK